MGHYESALVDLLATLDETITKSFASKVQHIQGLRFSDLRKKVEEIDSDIKREWPPPLIMKSLLLMPHFTASEGILSPFTAQNRSFHTVGTAFTTLEERLFQFLSPGQRSYERLKEQPLVLRSLLAVASSVVLFSSLPYWLTRSYTSYRISLSSLQPELVKLYQGRSNDLLRPLQNQVSTQTQVELALAKRTIFSAFSIPDGYSTTASLPSLSIEMIQTCIATEADLLSSITAFGNILNGIGMMDYGATL
jgi:hypothetical protein